MQPREHIEERVRALITGGVLRNHAVAQRLGLHVVDLQVLNLLALAGGRMTPSELAEATTTPRSSITRIVRRLTDQGYTVREDSSSDRRSSAVRVVPERLAAVTTEYQQQSAHLRDVLSRFTADESEVVARFLDDLTGHGRRAGRRHGPEGGP
jgi:DNA-binding MarR family transcriptional regulator